MEFIEFVEKIGKFKLNPCQKQMLEALERGDKIILNPLRPNKCYPQKIVGNRAKLMIEDD